MEAVFFVSSPAAAVGVACIDDVPGDTAAEPLAIGSPGALAALAQALGGGSEAALRPLLDATCQSFPVWTFSRSLCDAISRLDAATLDRVAEEWRARAADTLEDADLHDLSVCIEDLRGALRLRAPGERLFVLLEEKAW